MKKGRILLVDDNIDLCAMMGEMLRRENFDAQICHNGQQAIDILSKDQAFDLVISDLLMPQLDGIALITLMRQSKINIPVIIVTGGGVTLRFDDAMKAVENMADAVLKKPVPLAILLEKINQLIKIPA